MAYEIPQTTVTQFPPAAIQGMLGDNGPVDVFGALVSETLGVDAGLALILDTAQAAVQGYALKAKYPVDANSLVAGFSVYRSMGPRVESGTTMFPLNSPVNLLRKGRIWALVQNTVSQGDEVFAWFGTGVKGQIRNDDGSGNAVKVRGARVIRGAATNGFALIDLNIPTVNDTGTTVAGGSYSVVGPKTSAYTANIGELVKVDSSAGAVTITTPPAAGLSGRSFVVWTGADASTHSVTIDGNAAETINGSATLVSSTNNAYIVVTSDGTNWVASNG